jgi:sigma-B regulation protein RsbU (phosphoserine phosphatase)
MMRGFTSLPRPVLLVLAVLFAAAIILYSALWMVAVRWQLKSELGVNFFPYHRSEASLHISDVLAGGPAEAAGLRMDDRIVAINGLPLDNLKPFYEAVMHGEPGDAVELTVERLGVAQPMVVSATLEAPDFRTPPALTYTQRIALQLIWSYPVLFLVVGLPVLFLRLRDRNAWLLALVFAGCVASAPIAEMEGRIYPSLRGFALAYNVTFAGLVGPLFYYFFAVFPASSPLDRRWPWLKRVLLWGTLVVVAPLGVWVLLVGHSQPLVALADRVGEGVAQASIAAYGLGTMGLGLVSLCWNSTCGPTEEACRKTRVILWGTVAGLGPMLLLNLAGLLVGKPPYAFLFWVWAPAAIAVFLLPLSFAYAVVKHRVLEIPVLLRRSARYFLAQRGFTVLIILASGMVALLVGSFFVRVVLPRVEFATPVSIGFGISFGLVLAWAGVHVEKHVTERIDRAFFRSAYDARLILQDLAEKTRTANNREELAALLQFHLNQALFPRTLVVYLQTGEERLEAARGRVLAGLETVPLDQPVLGRLAKHGKPWDVPPPEEEDAPDLSFFEPLQPECLVPMLSRRGKLIGLVVLGPRLSEEPYSGEDKKLLGSAASQAGIALESIRMAEDIARRMQAEERVAHEMSIAKQVQEKLLPQQAPPLATLDYTGACVQRREGHLRRPVDGQPAGQPA